MASENRYGRRSFKICPNCASNPNMSISKPPHENRKAIDDISEEDLMEVYDTDKNRIISKAEIAAIVKDYNTKKSTDKKDKDLEILKQYETDAGCSIKIKKTAHLADQLDINETNARYAGYAAGFARLFRRSRYLAFSSDFGHAMSPVISKTLVNGMYFLALSYCIADVGWEAYKLKQRGYVTVKNEPMTMTQCIVERSAFQAVASMIVPTLLIHTSLDIAKKVTTKMGRFTKWGPSIVGLSMIPLLPLYLDHPIENALEWAFVNYGPWRKGKTHTN